MQPITCLLLFFLTPAIFSMGTPLSPYQECHTFLPFSLSRDLVVGTVMFSFNSKPGLSILRDPRSDRFFGKYQKYFTPRQCISWERFFLADFERKPFWEGYFPADTIAKSSLVSTVGKKKETPQRDNTNLPFLIWLTASHTCPLTSMGARKGFTLKFIMIILQSLCFSFWLASAMEAQGHRVQGLSE